MLHVVTHRLVVGEAILDYASLKCGSPPADCDWHWGNTCSSVTNRQFRLGKVGSLPGIAVRRS
jgi:hypothetical protein